MAVRRSGLVVVLAFGALSVGGPASAERRVVERDVLAGDERDAALRILGPGAQLTDVQVRHSLTGAHVRLATLAADGTPVLDGDVAVHLDGAGPRYRIRLVSDPGRGIWTLGALRRLGADQARALAAAAAGGTARPRPEAVARPVGPYLARPAWRVLVDAPGPHLHEVIVDAADGSATVGRDLLWRATGSGLVYRPNPVSVHGVSGLSDNNDNASTLLDSLREEVTLLGLDDTGVLRGDFVDVHNPSARASNAGLVFDYDRSQPEFEEVNVYYHLDRVQRQIQELGFTGAKAVLDRQFEVIVNALSEDQSFFDASGDFIKTGTGGVDDGEDADVIIHEYGHAVQADIVPGFGRSTEAQALGEGFADIQAFVMTETAAKVPLVERECLGAWDATTYDPPSRCMRRVDGVKHYPEHLFNPREEHYDGEIWSGMLYDMFQETGLGPLAGYQLVLESTFLYGLRETFQQAGEALLTADDRLYGGAHIAAIRRVLIRHGIFATITPPSDQGGTWTALTRRAFESTHPIAHDHDESQTITEPGAQAIRVHFSSLNMDSAASCVGTFCDAIYIYDGEGRLYARLGGMATDVTSPAVPGDTVVVRWVTNGSRQSPGFSVDKVETLTGIAPTPDAGVVPRPDAKVSVTPPDGDGSGTCACRVGQRAGRVGAGSWVLLGLTLAAAAASRRRSRSRS